MAGRRAAGGVERGADRADPAVHHVRRRDHVGAGDGVGHRRARQQRQRRVVVDRRRRRARRSGRGRCTRTGRRRPRSTGPGRPRGCARWPRGTGPSRIPGRRAAGVLGRRECRRAAPRRRRARPAPPPRVAARSGERRAWPGIEPIGSRSARPVRTKIGATSCAGASRVSCASARSAGVRRRRRPRWTGKLMTAPPRPPARRGGPRDRTPRAGRRRPCASSCRAAAAPTASGSAPRLSTRIARVPSTAKTPAVRVTVVAIARSPPRRPAPSSRRRARAAPPARPRRRGGSARGRGPQQREQVVVALAALDRQRALRGRRQHLGQREHLGDVRLQAEALAGRPGPARSRRAGRSAMRADAGRHVAAQRPDVEVGTPRQHLRGAPRAAGADAGAARQRRQRAGRRGRTARPRSGRAIGTAATVRPGGRRRPAGPCGCAPRRRPRRPASARSMLAVKKPVPSTWASGTSVTVSPVDVISTSSIATSGRDGGQPARRSRAPATAPGRCRGCRCGCGSCVRLAVASGDRAVPRRRRPSIGAQACGSAASGIAST